MSDDLISQEEIDALLNGGGDAAGDESAADASAADASAATEGSPSQEGDTLTDIERDALGEIGNISMGSAATTLSVLLGHKVSITTPSVSVDTLSSIKDQYPMPYLIVEVGYTVGIDGNNVLAIQAQDASIIADLMMGGDGTSPTKELNEIHMSAVGESMNQMMGSVATSLSTMFNKKIDISPPKVNMIDLGSEETVTEIVGVDDPIAKISFRMEVDGLIDSEIMQILPIPVAQEMVGYLLNNESEEEEEPMPAPAAAPAASAPASAAAAPQPMAAPAAGGAAAYGAAPHVASNVPVQPAMFAPLSTAPVQVNDANIGLILDVPLQVTVELGRTRKTIKEILELTNGSIIELDKLAGEPVDIMVNGKFLAKGEVVVIDENFGVRITDIVSPAERAQQLQ
ncbi:flagellar motor switch phosphatase FliY [Selenomonas sputigena]|uniref:Flagellar motor switch phosphatase FliY n=1 Tax=Selenomonas sputigena TaxID=69823 RepID=A0ABV3X345_9FIRM